MGRVVIRIHGNCNIQKKSGGAALSARLWLEFNNTFVQII